MNVLVTGGSGMLGRVLVPLLQNAGHVVLVGSRHPRGPGQVPYSFRHDVETLEGLLVGTDTVVHLATNHQSLRADGEAAERLVKGCARSGVGHLILVSIVGIDGHPFRYYRAKLAAEKVVANDEVPWTILRASQFHDFVANMADGIRRLPFVAVPAGIQFQPLDINIAAERIVELVGDGPSGRVSDLVGPEVLDLRDALTDYLAARGRRRLTLPMPMRGKSISAFRRGDAIRKHESPIGATFGEYLDGVRRSSQGHSL
ncbi:MAG: SDR family oxidoreductase [Desertimonas sp.]